MKKIKFEASGHLYENIDELPQEDRHLMEEAIKATQNSYAPYSQFKVGAALFRRWDYPSQEAIKKMLRIRLVCA